MTDLLIEDDESEEDEDEGADESPDSDEQPRASTDEVEQCPWCDHTETGMMRKAWMGQHKKREHPEESAAERAAADPAAQSPRRARPSRAGASSSRSRSRDSQPRRSGGQYRDVHDNVVLFYRMGGSVLAFRDPICGGAISDAANNAANAWVELAKTNPAVRKFWSGGGGATGWLELTMAHLPILLAVQGHHIAPIMERRRAAREEAMMGGDGEPFIDTDEAVVYSTDRPADASGDRGEDAELGLEIDLRGGFGVDETPFGEGGLG